MKHIYILISMALLCSCRSKNDDKSTVEGKVEREQITVVTKVPGKIEKILVSEGSMVHAGDTLAILSIPEVDAKAEQAQGALQSADAQYNMSVKGATSGQLVQLEAKVAGLKEQYEFAKKSIERLDNLLRDSLIPQQKYDETYAKFQGAKNQYLAAQAEIAEARNGARLEQQIMALGQKERAQGAVAEVKVAAAEKYVIAPQDMSIESINLKVGELALAGYPIVNGFLENSTYFRFTIPENKISSLQKGSEVTLTAPYFNNKVIKGKVVAVKALNSYANIATAYPDYDNQLALFEIKVVPQDPTDANELLTKTLVVLSSK
ncbi:HlyD family efflux transporter periplasmic adaptor subunit [Sphingobacterium psychroaquaticum]|uniref:HlyD family secretion protein n=1 Tax=Sphingobacterium psychroaquaticum TaxID=561061 RepID=UPI00106B1645|nr:biotin/lipoyl-binding protein [Sphingobacterium psychroaquaticum]QBQ41449.1 HlyD family efflux transporter periplasmic adaptor subunit [Sphingobacterium psychroaquaticum]